LDIESEPTAVAVTLSADAFRVMPDDGRASSVPPTRFPRLLHGTSEQRQDSEPIGRGEDLHREDLDEDVSIAGLSGGARGTDVPPVIRPA